MRKSKKFIAVVLALIIALSTLAVGASTITVSAASVAPVSLKSTAYNSNATVTIGWQKGSGGATGYQIAKKKLGDKSYTYIYVGGGNTQSYNDKSVVCGTIYYYQVRTVNKVGKTASYSSWSNSKTITTLYRPTVTSLNYLNNNMLNINWNKIKGVSHYKLAFKRTTDKAWNYREVKNTYYNVNNPTVGATYTIQVCPMNGSIAGQWSLVNSIIIVVKVSSVKLSQTSLSLELGQSKKLTATVAPSNAKNKTLQWSSSNTAAATVDQSGKVTSVAKGAATIYAKATDGSGKQGTCAVTVTGIKVSSITLAPTSVSLKPGQTTTLTATVFPANAETKAIQWTSSKTSVATVDKNGVITAKSDGTATIYAKASDGSNKQATCTVTVAGIKVTSITLTPKTVSLNKGESTTLSPTISPANADNKTLQWTSSKTSVATVDQSGKVTAVGHGTATIYAKATDGSNKQASCNVTVIDTAVGRANLYQWLLKNGTANGDRIQANMSLGNRCEFSVWHSTADNAFVFMTVKLNSKNKIEKSFHFLIPDSSDPPEVISSNLFSLTDYYDYVYTATPTFNSKTGSVVSLNVESLFRGKYATDSFVTSEFADHWVLINSGFVKMGMSPAELGLLTEK